MKILHVLTSPRAEGTPQLVLSWLHLKVHEHEILFLSGQGELKDSFKATGVPIFYNDQFKLKFVNLFKIIKLVYNQCNQSKYDIIICWPLGFSPWITIGARLGGVKSILAHNGNTLGNTFIKKYIHTYITFLIGKLFGNKIIACSNYVFSLYNQIPLLPSSHFFVVHNALDVKRFTVNNRMEDRKDVTMVAYLERSRDHKTLLEAWKIVESCLPDVQLKIVGDGILRGELMNLCSKLDLKNVAFVGRVNNVEEYLWKTKVYVFSTIHEGFGITLLEALASGCLVVATDVPACREVLADGKYGELVPPEDPTSLSEALINTYRLDVSDLQIANQIAYASGFTPEKMMNEYIRIANS